MSQDEGGIWQDLCSSAKDFRDDGEFEKALKLYRKALGITPNHEKLKNLIKKIEDHLDKTSMVHLGNGYHMAQEVYEQLYDYQKDGVRFLHNLFTKKMGGILGDDMGLGKTVQVCSYLSGMFDSRRIENALIVVPPPLIANWENELSRWTPGLNIIKVHECQKREKAKRIDEVKRRGGVCLTSYNTYTTSSDQLGEIYWDYCILDEGHKIKNHLTKTTKSLHGVKCQNRIILTGTPIMNSLKEFWSLYDWTHQGQLLGTFKTFTEKFENPIVRARQKDASRDEIRLGDAMSARLNEIISPYLLRRLKDNIKNQTSTDSGAPEMPKLMNKNDLICWIRVTDDQEKVYRGFLTSEEVKGLLNSTKSPLVGLTLLKKICDHPRLLSNQKCKMLGVSEGIDGLNDDSDEESEAKFDISLIPNDVLIQEAGKMKFLFGLLDNLRQENHKCLIFSQSRRILDIIEKVLSKKNFMFLRLDGRVRLMAERQQIIERFQNSRKYQVFLLTTKVGGVGLTLTAASRVIIYDPSWNPSTDAQAVDRAFRIGQKQDVVIYRLITCGTVEEKIYRRQVYKDSICKKTLQDSKNPFRHFTKQDLFQLFQLDNLQESETQKNLAEMFRGKRKSNEELEAHIRFLHNLDNFSGISDHDLLFSQEAADDNEEHDTAQSTPYLEGFVSQAMQRLNIDREENKMLSRQVGHYVGGGVLDGKSRDGRKKQDMPMPSENNLKNAKNRIVVHSSSEDDHDNDSNKENNDGGDDDHEEEHNDDESQNSSMALHSVYTKHKNIESSDEENYVRSSSRTQRQSLKGNNNTLADFVRLSKNTSATDAGHHNDHDEGKGKASYKAHFQEARALPIITISEDGDNESEDETKTPKQGRPGMKPIVVPDSDDDTESMSRFIDDESQSRYQESEEDNDNSYDYSRRSGDTSVLPEELSENISGISKSIGDEDETDDDTRDNRNDETVDDTRDETGDDTRDETGDDTRDETKEESGDETRDETGDDTRDETKDETGNDTRDETKDEDDADNLSHEETKEEVSRREHDNLSDASNTDNNHEDETDDEENNDDSGRLIGNTEHSSFKSLASNADVAQNDDEEEEEDDYSSNEDKIDDLSKSKADRTSFKSRTNDSSLHGDEDDEYSRDLSMDQSEQNASFEEQVKSLDASKIKKYRDQSNISLRSRGNVSENTDLSHMTDDVEGSVMDDDDDEAVNLYEDFLNEGKHYCSESNFEKALEKFEEAFRMYPAEEQDPIISKMISILKGKVKQSQEREETYIT